MFLIRDIMFCKPGQARPMVQKFLALDTLGRQLGFGVMRVMTDVSAERYWTVVAEMEVETMECTSQHQLHRETRAESCLDDAGGVEATRDVETLRVRVADNMQDA